MTDSHQGYGDTSKPVFQPVDDSRIRPFISGQIWVYVLLVMAVSIAGVQHSHSMEPITLNASVERRIDRTELDNALATSNRVSFASTATDWFAFRASIHSLDPPCGQFRNVPYGDTKSLAYSSNECEILSELSASWRWQNGKFAVGRQRLETPHVATDESLVIPNTFESVAATYDATDNISLSAYYVGAMADYDFQSDTVGFESLGNGLESELGNSAAIFAVGYANETFDAKAWFYHIGDIENVLYLEISHDGRLTSGLKYSLDLQYSRAVDIGDRGLGKIDSRVAGISATLQSTGFELYAAYNFETGASTTPPSIGGGPFFTSMMRQSIDSIIGDEGRAMLTGVSFSPWSGPLDGVDLNLAAGRFTAGKHNSYDMKEIDLGLTYQPTGAIRLDLNYSRLIDGVASENDNRFAVTLSVPF